MLEGRARVSPVVTERRNSVITETCARLVVEAPHAAYVRELFRAHRAPWAGALTASAIRTSFRVSQLSLSASTHRRKESRSYPARSSVPDGILAMAWARDRSLPPAGAPGAADSLPGWEAGAAGLESDLVALGLHPTRDAMRRAVVIGARRRAVTAILRQVRGLVRPHDGRSG